MKTIFATLTMVISLTAQAHNILIEGTFGSAEGCDLAIKGVLSDVSGGSLPRLLNINHEITVCSENAENAKFTNGATKKALSDGGVYWISGTLTGTYFDQIKIEEVARIGE
ncbi:MAG: hypothetical protein ACXWRG_18980 [Bdellovibrio sp.]